LRLPAVPGRSYEVDKTGIEILRTFERFRVATGQDGNRVYDDPNGEPNPAVEVRIIDPDGTANQTFLFDRYPQWHGTDGRIHLAYTRPIKDFVSHVEVIDQGRTVMAKAIEVNKPLHYRGYWLLQASYGLDPQTRRTYSVLAVVSDSGQWPVFIGYACISIGMIWRLWIKRILIQGGP
jgi:cytochrome c biogenesis protein ResB